VGKKMGAQILAALKAMLPAMLPEAEAAFDAKAIPALEKMITNSAASPDIKVVEEEMVLALKAIGDIELPKLAAKI
jgi:hypothetical protein